MKQGGEKEESVKIPITERAREYGYIIWPKQLDDAVRLVVGSAERVEITFGSKYLGQKRVDWKYRRISVGPRSTRRLGPEVSVFKISSTDSRSIKVICSPP